MDHPRINPFNSISFHQWTNSCSVTNQGFQSPTNSRFPIVSTGHDKGTNPHAGLEIFCLPGPSRSREPTHEPCRELPSDGRRTVQERIQASPSNGHHLGRNHRHGSCFVAILSPTLPRGLPSMDANGLRARKARVARDCFALAGPVMNRNT